MVANFFIFTLHYSTLDCQGLPQAQWLVTLSWIFQGGFSTGIKTALMFVQQLVQQWQQPRGGWIIAVAQLNISCSPGRKFILAKTLHCLAIFSPSCGKLVWNSASRDEMKLPWWSQIKSYRLQTSFQPLGEAKELLSAPHRLKTLVCTQD